MGEKQTVLITGGCGFMGSHFVRFLYERYPQFRLINLDALTYAGNLENLADIEQKESGKKQDDSRYELTRGNICDEVMVDALFAKHQFGLVVHFAAETHVDRSLFNFGNFVRTNIEGTRILLEAAQKYRVPRFIHISTDEVYGDVPEGASKEDAPLNPSSPYSASKTAGDMLARTYSQVYGMPVVIIRSSNNYGTHQYPEKLIPLTTTNLLEESRIPVHGDGLHVRSWLYVEDFCAALDLVIQQGPSRGIYNLAGEHKNNLDIIELVARHLGKDHRPHLMYVGDRPVADRRYAPDASKIERELGWKRKHSIEDALKRVVDWYRANNEWWKAVKVKKEFLDHYQRQSKALWY